MCLTYIDRGVQALVAEVGPLAQIDGGYNAALAGHARIAMDKTKVRSHQIRSAFFNSHFVIWQNHGIYLYGIDQVGVVANQTREFGLAYLLQLLGRKGRGLIGQLVPEAVAATQVAHLCGDDASKRRSQHGARQRLLRHAARP